MLTWSVGFSFFFCRFVQEMSQTNKEFSLFWSLLHQLLNHLRCKLDSEMNPLLTSFTNHINKCYNKRLHFGQFSVWYWQQSISIFIHWFLTTYMGWRLSDNLTWFSSPLLGLLLKVYIAFVPSLYRPNDMELNNMITLFENC